MSASRKGATVSGAALVFALHGWLMGSYPQ